MSRPASSPLPKTASLAGIAGVNYGGGAVGPRKRVTYTICTVTGDLPGAGTTAGVFVTLHGSIADSNRFQLLNPGEKNFVRGNTDKFLHTCLDLGELTSLTISQDGKTNFNEGFGAHWFVERATVRAGATEWVFPCRRWLSKEHDDGQMRRTLYSRSAEVQIQYKVITFTDDTPQAGTLGKVYIQLHGDAGTAGPMVELQNPSLHDVFERAQKDMFIIRARPVGKLNAVSIRHVSSPADGAWGLAGVMVRDMKSGAEYTFPCTSSLAANQTVNLPMRAGAQIRVGTSEAARKLEERAIKNILRPAAKVLDLDSHDPYKGMLHNREPPTRYDLEIVTSNTKNAGTHSK
jgi:hypothetical protein